MPNQLERIMAYANAGKKLYAPTAGVQKVVNADGTVTEIPYQEDRFGRRTVMTSQGPQVLPGHEGRDVYGDLGGKIGNVLGGLINKGRLGRQERIAEKSVAEQELANLTLQAEAAERESKAGGPKRPEEGWFDYHERVGTTEEQGDAGRAAARAPRVPANQAELEKARERLNYKTPQEKINYFDMSTVQSSVKPSALQEKLNIYLPAGTTVGGRTVNGVRTNRATREQLQEAMKLVTASSGSSDYFKGVAYKDGMRVMQNSAGDFYLLTPKGVKVYPGDDAYEAVLKKGTESGIQYASDLEFAKGQAGQRTEDLKNIRSSISGVRKGQDIYGKIADAVDDGAITGPFATFFPTWKAATTELENLQKQLGLNLIQNTTFGALSESELKFALDTAMPPFRGPRLKKWALEKQRTQKLLIAYLYDMSQFISNGEGTAQDFETKKYMEQQRNLTLNDPQESSNNPPPSITNAESDIPELEDQEPVSKETKEAFLNAG